MTPHRGPPRNEWAVVTKSVSSLHLAPRKIVLRSSKQHKHQHRENPIAREAAQNLRADVQKMLRQEVIFEIRIPEKIDHDAQQPKNSPARNQPARVERPRTDFTIDRAFIFRSAL